LVSKTFLHVQSPRGRELDSKLRRYSKLGGRRIRPLNFNDLPLVTDFCEELIYSSPSTWINVTNTVSHLKADPSFVLGLSIPSTDVDSRISHNLPLPDFDETGLIGRDDLVEQVKKLCLGGFPVISIVGEGGIGKSALALKVAYELLDDPKSKFDAIIWVTSKTTQITVNEIRDIRGAITDSIGVISEISSQLGTSTTTQPLEEIAEYLSTFKIALFIDNLETIMDDTIRTFVGALPEGSKIIITSRIGLGAYEYPIKLSGMAEKYASELLRNLSKLRNVPLLLRQDEATVRRFVNRMHLDLPLTCPH
ncbi:NB-ARC domain-containing protein, partial [Xanthomonas campestris]